MGTGWLEKNDRGHFTCFQVGSHITQILATGDARDAGDVTSVYLATGGRARQTG